MRALAIEQEICEGKAGQFLRIELMNNISRVWVVCLLLLALSACAGRASSAKEPSLSASAPDPDATRLVALSQQAALLAQKESPVVELRQVDTDLSVTDFRFVDSAMTREIMVVIPQPDAPVSQWNTVVNTVSPLLTSAGSAVDLVTLKAGPSRVAQALTAHWPGCAVRSLILYPKNATLTWEAFCNTSAGVVSGSMDDQTGIFQPSSAPPASFPVTATPLP